MLDISTRYLPLDSQGISHIMADDFDLMRTRRSIRSIVEVLNGFRDLSHTMPVGQVVMFLLVALNEGADQTQLAELMDIRKSTASRYLLDLSDKTRDGGRGYELITRDPDPTELRRNVYSLSPKGRALLAKLNNSSNTGGEVVNLS